MNEEDDSLTANHGQTVIKHEGIHIGGNAENVIANQGSGTVNVNVFIQNIFVGIQPNTANQGISFAQKALEELNLSELGKGVFKQQIIYQDITSQNSGEPSNFSNEIDAIRELIPLRPNSALQKLEDLRSKFWNEMSNEARFRIITNIAACKLRNDLNVSAQLFLEAENYAEGLSYKVKASINKALAFKILGKVEEAKSILLGVINESQSGTKDKIDAWSQLINISDIEEFTPPDEYINDYEIQFVRGTKYLSTPSNVENITKAIDAFQTAQKIKDTLEIKRGIADAEMMRLIGGFLYSPKIGLPSSLKEPLKYLQIKYKKLIDEYLETELDDKYLVIGNLVTILSLQGKKEEAYKFSALIPMEVAQRYGLVRLKINVLMESERFEEADKLLSLLPDDVFEDKLFYIAYVKYIFKDFISSLDALNRYIGNGGKDFQSISLKGFVLEKLEGIQSAIDYLKSELTRLNSPFKVEVTLAKFYGMQKDYSKFDTLIAKYERCELEQFESFELADELYSVGDINRAFNILVKICDTTNDTPSLRVMLSCATIIKNDEIVREAIINLPAIVLEEEFYLRLQSWYYDFRGELNKALSFIEKYLNEHTDDLAARLAWMHINERLLKEDVTEKWLSDNHKKIWSASLLDCLQWCHYLNKYEFKESCTSLLYKLVNENPDSKDAAFAYITIFLGGHAHIPEVGSNVVDGVAVGLKKNDIEVFYLLDSSINSDASKKIYNSSSDLFKLLNGKLVGASIQMRGENYEISQIKHKYLHRFHELLESFETTFPNHNFVFKKMSLGSDETGEKAVQNIIEELKLRELSVKNKIEIYKKHPIPIKTLARFMGVNRFDLILGMEALTDFHIKTCAGTLQQRDAAVRLLRSDAGFIFDSISLFKFLRLNLLTVLKKLFQSINIVQDSVDALIEYKTEISQWVGKDSKSMASIDGAMYLTERSDDELRQKIQQIDVLLDWIKLHATILPSSDSVSFANPELLKILEKEDRRIWSALIEHKMHVFSDDGCLREFMKIASNIDGVWLQPLLEVACFERIISIKDYASHVFDLSSQGYTFTSINSDVLTFFLDTDKDKLIKLISELSPSKCDINTALRVVSKFIVNVWLANLPLDEKERLTYIVINALTDNCTKYVSDVIQSIARLNLYFYTNKSASLKTLFLNCIGKWCMGHFLTSNDLKSP